MANPRSSSMKYLPHIVLLGLAGYVAVAVLGGEPAVVPTGDSQAQHAPAATPPATTGDAAAPPAADAPAAQQEPAPPLVAVPPTQEQTQPPPPTPTRSQPATPRLLGDPDAPRTVFTHHNTLHRAFPREMEPLAVFVNNDFNHAPGDPPPTNEQIDAAFRPGTRAHNKAALAVRADAVIIDDCEWMPTHYWSLDRGAIDDAIRAKLHIIQHLRRLAPNQKIALYSPVGDPWLWVGLATMERDGGTWDGHARPVLLERKARWDEIWAIYNEKLFPAYDALTVVTYARVRNADYYPLEPERWWALEDWLPAHIEQAKRSGLPVVAYLWYRFGSEPAEAGEPGFYPLADLSYLSAMIAILREHDIRDAALWMHWDERLDSEAVRRIDLILEQFRAP